MLTGDMMSVGRNLVIIALIVLHIPVDLFIAA